MHNFSIQYKLEIKLSNISNKWIANNKKEGLRKSAPGFNVEFGPPSTLHGHQMPPNGGLHTPLLFYNKFAHLDHTPITSRLTKRFPLELQLSIV